MDLWVVAAATGAGYIAKHWKNLLSKEGQTSSDSFSFYSIHRQPEPSNLLKQIWDQSTPLQRLALKQLDKDGFFMDEKDFDGATVDSDNHENYSLLPLTSSPPGLYENESSQRNGNGREGNSNFSNVSRHLRSNCHGYFLEPIDLLESCLETQLHREYAAMEEYVYSSLHSPAAVRPLLLTEGHRIISGASRDFNLLSEDIEENERQLLPKKQKSLSIMRDSGRQGNPNGNVLFVIGITIGVMFTILANKRESQNLNELLKETESLVQDLQEELEMKEQLNVKELADEGFDPWRRNKLPLISGKAYAINHEQDLSNGSKFGDQELDDQKAENHEAMSKIEAELEAELERLELNMRTSSLQRISNGVELDPDIVPDIVHGDLKLDKVNDQPGGSSESDQDVSGASTNYPDNAGNYAVSPMELSLRLHEVIEAKLEARILELETALENSQNRLETLEMESKIPWKGFPCQAESSSQDSSTFIDGHGSDDSWQ